ncbi:hypothetical protein RJ639_041443, partial [Escallonia herrerae]
VASTMLPKWSRAVTQMYRAGTHRQAGIGREFYAFSSRSYAKVAAVEVPAVPVSSEKSYPSKSEVNLNKMFWSKPCSLALAPDSPLRIEEPKYEGIRRIVLKLLLFYSKQSKSLRGANVIYSRVISQVDKPAIYNVFSLEKTFKTTFSLLVLHMWLCLRRLKEEGKEVSELGQYVYEIYNHDLELRVSKAGVNLLLTRWMKDLEKIFYGNIVAYDNALLPEAKQDELQNVLWRNVFSDDGSSKPDEAALRTVQAIYSHEASGFYSKVCTVCHKALSRYIRREALCFSLTDKEAILSGNFSFTSLENPKT